MSGPIQGFRARARAQAEELLAAIDAAEAVIVTTIERECEALRAGRMLAARALHTRLCDAARLYLEATKAARASLWTLEQVLPGTEAYSGGTAAKRSLPCSRWSSPCSPTERAAAGGQSLEGFEDAPRSARTTRFPPPAPDVRKRA